MANPRNKELESKLLRLFRDEKLKWKDDLLTLFSKHLGFNMPRPSFQAEALNTGAKDKLPSL